MKEKQVSLKLSGLDISNSNRRRPFIIAGPCSAESETQLVQTALKIQKIKGVCMLRAGVWKPRTRPNCFEGAGIDGLNWLKTAGKESGLPVAVEVANSCHVEAAMKVGVDAVWIGARTTVNPFTVGEIAESLRGTRISVFVKNPVCPDLGLWIGALERLNQANVNKLAAVHRGFASRNNGVYRNQPIWEIPIELKRLVPNLPVICDPSHIAGNREYIQSISQQSIDLAMDGLMIESHISPETALSHSAQQLEPGELGKMIRNLKIRTDNGDNDNGVTELDTLRQEIDSIDSDLLCMIARRIEIAGEIGRYKKSRNMTILQMSRWKELLSQRLAKADMLGLEVDSIRKIYETIHTQSIAIQSKIMN